MSKNIKRHYVHYLEWEDFKAGMWGKMPKQEESAMIERAIEFTGNDLIYGASMMEVIWNWPRTMLHNLTNPSLNKRAFLGHCAAFMKIQSPEYITRIAWWELTQLQRDLADEIAEKTINHWLLKRNTKQLSFDFRD